MTHKTPMPFLPADQRADTFQEVAMGYTAQQAREEAARCLQCKNAPCVAGCPVGVDIPAFMARLKADDTDGALAVIHQTNCLPAVCGRVCPQEEQCEKRCVRAKKGESVAIGRLERYCADHGRAQPVPAAAAQKRVAVIGAGPAGLACAGELARRGAAVTVFEALHAPGGVLTYGIPAFRLPKDVVAREVDALTDMGVTFVTNAVIGRSLTLPELGEMGYAAVFIGTGAGLPRFMGIPGENLNFVYSANEFLTRVNLMNAGRPGSHTPLGPLGRVAVIGGGNVAMDAARVALRLGAESVTLIYRRSEAEMPARAEEIQHAREEGVQFLCLADPIAFEGEGAVSAVRCQQMCLGEPDASGRCAPLAVPGSTFTLPVDCAVVAIGTRPNPLLAASTPGLATNRHGGFAVTEQGETSLPLVYAGGDAVTGAATVILAMGAGRAAAQAIAERLGF